MKLNEAIEVLKDANYIGSDEYASEYDREMSEAIDTVVSALEKPLPSDEVLLREASDYIDSIRNKIDTYCYCDVNEAFMNGATWMRDLRKEATE